jgi:hypothetical protein
MWLRVDWPLGIGPVDRKTGAGHLHISDSRSSAKDTVRHLGPIPEGLWSPALNFDLTAVMPFDQEVCGGLHGQ